MTQATKQTWLEEGLTVLAQDGAEAIRIDTLCKRLKVTKGSFYHHFKNRNAYLEGILDYWEDKYTSQFIEHSQQGKTPVEKMHRLTELSTGLADKEIERVGLEVAIRAWAMHDDLAREYLTRVDQRRIAYVQELANLLLDNPEQSKVIAQIMYTILVGSQHLLPRLTSQELNTIYQTLEHLMGIEGD